MNFLDSMYWKSRIAVNKFLRDEEGDVNIVSMVVLIGIAVLLAVFFKDQIGKLVKNLFNVINSSADGVINNSI